LNSDSPFPGDRHDDLRSYTRWRLDDSGLLHADFLTSLVTLMVDSTSGKIIFQGIVLTPDESRLIGVRMVDAAVLADGDRAIRRLGLRRRGQRNLRRRGQRGRDGQ
jgi:hypothetical protein